MSEELKSCPFCGCDEPMVMEHTSLDWVIHCKKCHAKTGRHHTLHGAIYSWNSRHESDELPEWVVNKLNDSIVDCGLLEAELKDDNDIEEAVRVGRRANTLRWVLSLRKPEEKE